MGIVPYWVLLASLAWAHQTVLVSDSVLLRAVGHSLTATDITSNTTIFSLTLAGRAVGVSSVGAVVAVYSVEAGQASVSLCDIDRAVILSHKPLSGLPRLESDQFEFSVEHEQLTLRSLEPARASYGCSPHSAACHTLPHAPAHTQCPSTQIYNFAEAVYSLTSDDPRSVKLDRDGVTIWQSSTPSHAPHASYAGQSHPPTPLSFLHRSPSRLFARTESGPSWSLAGAVSAVGDGCGSCAVASVGRVLGDRSTVIKYLNPDLVAALSGSSHDPTRPTLSLIDSLTGATVERVKLESVRDEVHFKLRDHQLVITHRLAGQIEHLTKITSIEMFRSGNNLKLISRSFVSTEPVVIAGFTETERGMSAVSPVFIDSRGRAALVPRRALDPRRTLDKPSKHDQEEGLLPYEPVLALDSRWIVSPTIGVSRVASSAGEVESESVLTLELEGGEPVSVVVTPSKSFDRLSQNFNQTQLVVMLALLGLGAHSSRTLLARRQVRNKWYSQ